MYSGDLSIKTTLNTINKNNTNSKKTILMGWT